MSNWSYESQKVRSGFIKYTILRDGNQVSFAEVAHWWRTVPEFVQFYNDLLSGAPFAAFFWEHPPVRRETLGRIYEFVLVDSPVLAGVQADYSSFISFFRGTQVVSFPNLRGDAQLIAPAPASTVEFPHLAAFCRRADKARVLMFWKTIGTLVENDSGAQTRWLSTSGLGVHWLHVRWDMRPKYYTCREYREERP